MPFVLFLSLFTFIFSFRFHLLRATGSCCSLVWLALSLVFLKQRFVLVFVMFVLFQIQLEGCHGDFTSVSDGQFRGFFFS
jgi:hypothetical protein